jgi:2-polyprenyl-3-methyl-5-hydroxy-6-metoxy-1,4-benzoquinol methylase
MPKRRDRAQSDTTVAAPEAARRGPLLPTYPPRDYLGQLDPAFQAALSARRAGADLDDLVWYHAVELPDGRVLPGAWDLRGHESAYLGGVDVAGKRVLELGPATGYLTFYMERMGAEVVSFEAGFDVSIDLLPVKGVDQPEEKLRVMQETIDRNHDAWWYLHRAFGSSAKFVQGNIYDLPADLGVFDITLVGAILLHLREPWGVLSQAAARTTDTMIVTEPLQDDAQPPEANVMRFSPSAEHHMTNWWSIYPGAVVSMLSRLGFGRTETTMHSQRHHLAHDIGADAIEQRMYTVVGRRET